VVVGSDIQLHLHHPIPLLRITDPPDPLPHLIFQPHLMINRIIIMINQLLIVTAAQPAILPPPPSVLNTAVLPLVIIHHPTLPCHHLFPDHVIMVLLFTHHPLCWPLLPTALLLANYLIMIIAAPGMITSQEGIWRPIWIISENMSRIILAEITEIAEIIADINNFALFIYFMIFFFSIVQINEFIIQASQ